MNRALEAVIDDAVYAGELEAQQFFVTQEAMTAAYPILRSVDGQCIDGTKDTTIALFDKERLEEGRREQGSLIVQGREFGNAALRIASKIDNEDWISSDDAIYGFALHALAKQRALLYESGYEDDIKTSGVIRKLGQAVCGLGATGVLVGVSAPGIEERPSILVPAILFTAIGAFMARTGQSAKKIYKELAITFAN